jgi:hypothetical protein
MHIIYPGSAQHYPLSKDGGPREIRKVRVKTVFTVYVGSWHPEPTHCCNHRNDIKLKLGIWHEILEG